MKPKSPGDNGGDYVVPLPIQTFLWRQTSSFVRPKLGKLHEASCIFCQQAPGHHEMKEACKSLEKVLVQNIQFGLSPSLTEAIRSIPRWKFVQCALPHVMLCAAQLISERKDTNNLHNVGTAASKLLYTLHWTLLDAAEECADADREAGVVPKEPFPYIFHLTCIQEFVYLFAPLRHLLKEADLQNFRLENGLKIWPALWDYRHPNAPCFTTPVRPRKNQTMRNGKNSSAVPAGCPNPSPAAGSAATAGLGHASTKDSMSDVFIGATVPAKIGICEPNFELNLGDSCSIVSSDQEHIRRLSKDEFPETIPEETSSTEEEHVVIFRLAPAPEDQDAIRDSSVYRAESSIIQPRTYLTADYNSEGSHLRSTVESKKLLSIATDCWMDNELIDPQFPHRRSSALEDVTIATFLDVAVVRCLFMPRWSEEGVHWALQFLFYRLQEISEEMRSRCPQRKRSSSLPVPKIEVSLCSEGKTKDSPKSEFYRCEDGTSFDINYGLLEAASPSPTPSERAFKEDCNPPGVNKRRPYKMADLKAFVESRLLSRSEKALEKDEKSVKNELDAESIPPRPLSALAHTTDPEVTKAFLDPPPLMKGKSMPSLSCLVDELASGYLGLTDGRTQKKLLEMKSATKSPPALQVASPPVTTPAPPPCNPLPMNVHPVITVTEPVTGSQSCTQVPNTPEYIHPASRPHPPPGQLNRSQTDSNIQYPHEELAEAAGSAHFVNKDGTLNFYVILMAIHAVTARSEVCSVRVCETSLSILELLLDLGVVSLSNEENPDPEDVNNRNSDPTPGAVPDNLSAKTHSFCFDIVAKVFQHVGCPHGCGDSRRDPSSDFIRSQGLLLMARLHRISSKFFRFYLRQIVTVRYSLAEVVDFLHALVGFCVDSGFVLSPMSQKRNSRFGPDPMQQGMGFIPNFNAPRTTEGHVISCIFKPFVTRLTASLKFLKSSDNVSLYCDVRQLLAYIKDSHGAVFRRVLLSGLLDAATRPQQNLDDSPPDNGRIYRDALHGVGNDLSAGPGSTFFVVDETMDKSRKPGSRKGTGSELDSWNDASRKNSVAQALVMSGHRLRERERCKGRFSLTSNRSGKKSSRLALAVSWIRKERRYPPGQGGGSPPNGEEILDQQSSLTVNPSMMKFNNRGANNNNVGVTLQRARRRVEHHLTRIGFGRSRKQVISREVTPDPSRRNSLEMDASGREMFLVTPRERKMVSGPAIYDGMLRLNFFLEACQPGTIPDAHLIAAVLDLPQAPVVARAAFLFECAHFVHRCNRGQWPSWMKLNLPFFRPSGPLSNRGTPSGQRRTHILQRLGGRMFFSWAEAIGLRLEEILIEDAMCVEDFNVQNLDEHRQRMLLDEDENEDFLVEASVNPSGRDFPWSLRLAACMLLFEITSFLRDSYRRLPRSTRVSVRSGNDKSHGNAGSLNVGSVTERQQPAAVPQVSESAAHSNPAGLGSAASSHTGDRRWSMALSFMGQSQASAQSLQSITGDGHSMTGAPTGERKISFVLHEPDDESMDSSNTTLTFQGEDEEKRNRRLAQQSGRPYLLRRSTTGNAAGSFKRRSLRLRRSHRERRDPDSDSAMKRSDSVRSKRKVSSISSRSDISDVHMELDVSGEESPGILSDDQPPESPTDLPEVDECISSRGLPWTRAVLLLANSFNYQCSHQNVCHPRCFRRQMRACSRMLNSVRKIYGDEPHLEAMEFMSFSKKTRAGHTKDEKKEKKLTSRPGSPIRRRDSTVKRDRIDKSVDLMSKASSYQSTSGLSRDHIDHDNWDRSKVESVVGMHKAEGEDEQKAKKKEEHPLVKYIKFEVMDLFQAPLLVLIKSATILNDDTFLDIIPVAWELLLDFHKETAAAAAAIFILSAVRCPEQITTLLNASLKHHDPVERVKSLLKFQVLWKSRYQVWPRMEEGASHTFKVPPHSIEFTLPSPKIGVESLPVVDPPWMPYIRTGFQEVTLNQDTHRSLVTATKSRKKQQTEQVEAALKAEEDRKCTERENFLITAVPVTMQASYEPALHHAVGDDHDDADDETEQQQRIAAQPLQMAQVLFPSCLCAAIVPIVSLLDDFSLTPDGVAVHDVANQVVNSCLVEDTALFLRYVLEKLTRDRQDEMFGILRRLLRFFPQLPQQTAFTLHNYLIGFIMFYVRSPCEGSQDLVGNALSLLSTVAPNVQGLLFKDLKQILRKEQCDATILITANVPSAKKIVVHGPGGPDAGGIPSQFPIQEDTQFCQILQESLDFFGVEENKHREYFLVDHRTNQIHNPAGYVRDYYFFKRSQYPQLSLVHMEPARAHDALQIQAFTEKMAELGKVLFVSSILKSPNQLVARVLFLHEELMKLPSFPRKALEADLNLNSNGCMGKELCSLDFMHKLSWVKLVSRMFEAMVGNFAYSGDIHLFINVVNGALVVHCEDAIMLRFCMATYINAAHHFRNVFALNGYSLIIPTILRIYSNYQNNSLVTRTIEFTIQQFYIMHRKPFMLQLFGSVAPLLDTDESSVYGDAQKIRVQSLFRLLLSLEHIAVDPVHILDLVVAEKPLKALDFCYHGENDTINVLDSISLAVMGASYAIDTARGHQLLTILEAILPAYLKHLQSSAGRKDPRTERDILHQIGVAIKTLINNAEALTKHYTGPQRTFEKTPSQKRSSNNKAPLSTAIEIDEDSHSRFLGDHFSHRKTSIHDRDTENDSEIKWQEFRSPRTTLLSLVSDYYTVCCARLTELNKKQGQDNKTGETLDVKCHLRLADIAHTLLKVASYDSNTMSCRGLQVYMTVLMPSAEWSLEPLRPALTMLFRRLDKIFVKIDKIPTMRKNLKWDACAGLLQGVFLTLRKCPYIVHVQHLRSLVNTCQSLILGDLSSSMYNMDGSPVRGGNSNRRPSFTPPPSFCAIVVQLIAMQILALGETYSLEQACGGSFIFPTPERTESVLLHLILPLCLRVGSGRKDAPRIRQSDISFALTVIFHALNPPQPRPTTGSSKNVTSSAEARSGSLSVQGSGDVKIRTRPTLCQVAFLGLKILMTCFSQQLTLDWPRVARCVRDIGDRRDGGGAFWNFLVFVATQRGPLFAHILPLMWIKVSTPVENEEEQILQDLLRQKLNGSSEISPLPAGELMECFQTELAILNEEFTHFREDEPETDNRRSIVPDVRSEHSNTSGFSRRPTFDSNASRRDMLTAHGPLRGSSISNTAMGGSNLRRQWSVRSESHHPLAHPQGRHVNLHTPTTASATEGFKTVDKMMRRTSYAGEIISRGSLPPAACCTATSDSRLHRRSLGPSTSSISRTSSISETEFYEQDETAFAEGLSPTTDTTPSTCDASESSTHIHPRLHRQKLQSKGKTFRFKKQAMANIEVSHIEVEQELVTLPPVKAAVDSHPFQLLLVPSASRLGAVRRGNNHEFLTAESRLVTTTPSSSDSTTVTTSLSLTKAVTNEPANEQKSGKSGNPPASVTVGMAVQVSASSYVPAAKAHRTTQYKSTGRNHPNDTGYQFPLNPPPVPPRSVRLAVNYPGTNNDGSNSSNNGPPSPFNTKPGSSAATSVGGSSDAHFKNIPTMLGAHMARGCMYREPPLLEESDSMDRAGDLSNSSSSVNAVSDSELDSRSGTLSCVRSQDGDTSNESLTLGEDSVALITREPTVRSQHPHVERDENTLI